MEQMEQILPQNEKVPIGEIEIETLCQNRAEIAPFAPNLLQRLKTGRTYLLCLLLSFQITLKNVKN